jgi:dTDP-glucose 4,6-dehydratase
VTGEPDTTPVDQLPESPHLLVTGGAGFIGSAFVREILGRGDGTRITVLDKLTYAGNRSNLATVEGDAGQAARYRFVEGDIADPAMVGPLVAEVDAIVNFAAESHVDRSILDPEAFLRTGVIGVHVLLEAIRAAEGRRVRFVQVSTDEVYGSVEEGYSREGDALAPRSPYSAAKAAGEQLVRSYFVTYGLDVLVTRGSNTYGPFQHPEKLIPLFISNAMDDEPLPLYGDGMQRRDWLYVTDHAGAVEYVLHHGTSGETYNVPGEAELPNREVVAELLRRVGKPWSLVRSVEDRPGHDRRYAMDGSKLRGLGWHNHVGFEEGIAETVEWFRANEAWWRAIRSGEWESYYSRQYAARLAGGQAVSLVHPVDATAVVTAAHTSAGLAMAEATAAEEAMLDEAAADAQAHEPPPELG